MEKLKAPSPFELFLPETPGPFPLICMTPLLGRFLFLEDLFWERRFAQFFQKQGFAVALLERPIFEFNPARGLEQIQEYLEESVARSKSVLDRLSRQKEIDPTRIGSFGISFGAEVHCLWAGSEPRLKAHVFVLAGGNLAEIICTSRDPLMRSYFKALSKSLGPDRKALREALRESIQSDPLRVCRSIPRENVLMCLGLLDRVIRFRYGLALWRALGKPETVFLPLGHYPSILAWPIFKWKVLDFFKKKLGP